MIIANLKKGTSDLGVDYGCVHPQYGGIVMDVATLPDGVYFHVENGYWWGYVTSKDGVKYIYTGVAPDAKDPTEPDKYVRKMALGKGEAYDVAVGEIKMKQHAVTYGKRPKWIKFDILHDHLADINAAILEGEKLKITVLESFKNGVVDLIDGMTEDGKVDSELLKHNIEELHENMTERT